MPYIIDILRIQERVFGLANSRIKRYKVGEVVPGDSTNPFGEIEQLEVDEDQVLSSLGTPVISPVTFLAGRYQDGVKDGQPIYVEYPEYILPFASLCEVNLPRNIVRTKVAGRNGSVKEFISNDDYTVRFKGLIVNEQSDAPPEAGIRAFNRLITIPQAIEVQSDLLEWFGISDLVVDEEGSGIFQIEGFGHVVGFTLNCISDNPVEVKLRDGL